MPRRQSHADGLEVHTKRALLHSALVSPKLHGEWQLAPSDGGFPAERFMTHVGKLKNTLRNQGFVRRIAGNRSLSKVHAKCVRLLETFMMCSSREKRQSASRIPMKLHLILAQTPNLGPRSALEKQLQVSSSCHRKASGDGTGLWSYSKVVEHTAAVLRSQCRTAF